MTTTSKAPLTPLTADFADRLEALRAEAESGGHTDLDHILEMAVGIAPRRCGILFKPSPTAAVDDRLPN